MKNENEMLHDLFAELTRIKEEYLITNYGVICLLASALSYYTENMDPDTQDELSD